MGAYGIKQAVKSGISYFKANEPYIKAISSEFKNDAAMLKQSIRNYNKKPFGSNEKFDSLRNLKPGVKVTNQSESSSSDDIENLINISENESKRGTINGRNPAQRLADKLRSLPKKDRPSTVMVIRTKDGKYLVSTNKTKYLNEEVKSVLDELGNKNNFNYGCAEVSGVSRGVDKGYNLEGADIYIAYVRGLNGDNSVHGSFHEPCDVCGPLLNKYGINVIRW